MSKVFNKKVLIVLAIIAIISIAFATSVFAAASVDTDIWGQGKNFIAKGNSTISFNSVWTDLKPIAQIITRANIRIIIHLKIFLNFFKIKSLL